MFPHSDQALYISPPHMAVSTLDHAICTACGTQFPPLRGPVPRTACPICDDPRQFVPAAGQSFTTLRLLRDAPCTADGAYGADAKRTPAPAHPLRSEPEAYSNVFTPFAHCAALTSLHTAPKFGIGQRALVLRTPAGAVLWDCLAFLDQATVARIVHDYGALRAIVISHPHYYTTWRAWAAAFGCAVYLARRDQDWVMRREDEDEDEDEVHSLIRWIEPEQDALDLVVDGVPTSLRVLQLGGHFPGSLVALFEGWLMVADTLVTTPAGMGLHRVMAMCLSV